MEQAGDIEVGQAAPDKGRLEVRFQLLADAAHVVDEMTVDGEGDQAEGLVKTGIEVVHAAAFAQNGRPRKKYQLLLPSAAWP